MTRLRIIHKNQCVRLLGVMILSILCLTTCFVAEANAATKISINRSFLNLTLGMSVDEYRKSGWETQDFLGQEIDIPSEGAQEINTYSFIKAHPYAGNTKSSDNLKKYPNDLENINRVMCKFIDGKLCYIGINWCIIANQRADWQAFNEKLYEKYGNSKTSTDDSELWTDDKTSLVLLNDGKSVSTIYYDNQLYAVFNSKERTAIKKVTPDL